ncbi:MAG: hypothetical protein AB1744_14305, partial [Candidatus Zixiibacteriota bacterium]
MTDEQGSTAGLDISLPQRTKDNFMQKTMFLVTVLSLCPFLAVLCQGESLRIIDKMALSPNSVPYPIEEGSRLFVGNVYFLGDTTLVSSGVGLLAKFSNEDPWVIIVNHEPWGNNWWEDDKKARKRNVLFSTRYLWRMPGAKEMVVLDTYIDAAYKVNLDYPDNARVRFWKRPDEKSSVGAVSIYNDLIFYGLISGYHDSILAVSHTDMSGYRRLFECPAGLKRRFDS